MKQFKSIQFRWNEPLGVPECPYAYRWVFIFFGYSIRIHNFLRSDDKRYFHDHAWWFLTLVLKGSYTDVSPNGDDVMKQGSIRYRQAKHPHYVKVSEGGCWTILITGKPNRNWGFWVDGKFKRPLKYFHKFGHPPCSEQ
jgi:hypothetical protein|tara:strand:- start:8706 stop:9122 length:417 start_codon:yes stop_codon:yes gene_type:complete